MPVTPAKRATFLKSPTPLIPDCGDTDSSAALSALEQGACIPLDCRTFFAMDVPVGRTQHESASASFGISRVVVRNAVYRRCSMASLICRYWTTSPRLPFRGLLGPPEGAEAHTLAIGHSRPAKRELSILCSRPTVTSLARRIADFSNASTCAFSLLPFGSTFRSKSHRAFFPP
jgi:hypothetical protein